MRLRYVASIIALLALLAGCDAMSLYTDSVRMAFDPNNRQKLHQPVPNAQQQKERLCGTSPACR